MVITIVKHIIMAFAIASVASTFKSFYNNSGLDLLYCTLAMDVMVINEYLYIASSRDY